MSLFELIRNVLLKTLLMGWLNFSGHDPLLLFVLRYGLNTEDKRLVELAEQMGGTPIEIWESREYWSEVDAMRFLRDRIGNEDFYCQVFNKMRRNLIEYAREYEKRFTQFPEQDGSRCSK